MPKIVDHDKRRREIAEFAIEAIAKYGLDAVKLEHVAEFARCTTGSLMHFYPSKKAILEAALAYLTTRLGERYTGALDEPDMAESLASVLPLDAARRRPWLVWVSYLGAASNNVSLRRAHHALYAKNRVWVRRILEAAIERGEIREDLDLKIVTDQLIAVTDGIGVWATMNPKAWNSARQKAQIASFIKLLK